MSDEQFIKKAAISNTRGQATEQAYFEQGLQ